MKRGHLLLLFLAAAGSPVQAEEAKVPVVTSPLSALARAQVFDAPATVVSLNTPLVAAQVSGIVEAITVRVGDPVGQGDTLVRINCDDARTRLQMARAGLQRNRAQVVFARAQLGRAVELRKQRSVSAEVVEQRAMELQIATADEDSQAAEIEQLQRAIARCEIKAPFDALVLERLAQEGALASPGTPLLELVQLENAEAVAQLRESDLTSMQAAGGIVFRYAEQDFPVQLRAAPPVVDARTRTREARLTFIGRAAPPGAPGRLRWTGSAAQLPADLLVRRNGLLGLFLARRGKAVFHPLADAREGQPVAVRLPADTLLVTEGRQRLNDGDRISVADQSP